MTWSSVGVSGSVSTIVSSKVLFALKGLGAGLTFSKAPGKHFARMVSWM